MIGKFESSKVFKNILKNSLSIAYTTQKILEWSEFSRIDSTNFIFQVTKYLEQKKLSNYTVFICF